MNASDLTKTFVADGGGYPDNPTGPRIDKVRQIFASFPGRLKVLDIGCANGAILRPLTQQHELHGVDIGEQFVRLANENGIKAVEHNIESGPLPYSDKTFGAVFCGETIEHLVNTDRLMFELNRVLKPGGRLVLTFPNIRTLLSLAMMAFFDLPPMYSARYHSFHFRDFTLKTIKMVLRNHGFRYEKAVGSAFFLPTLRERFPRLAKLLPFWAHKPGECFPWLATHFPSWAHTVVVVATKEMDSDLKHDRLGALDY